LMYKDGLKQLDLPARPRFRVEPIILRKLQVTRHNPTTLQPGIWLLW